MVMIQDGRVVVSFSDRNDAMQWSFSFARLCALLERIQRDDVSIGKILATTDVVKESLAQHYHLTGQQFQAVLNLLYPPLSGTSDRTTEAPEG